VSAYNGLGDCDTIEYAWVPILEEIRMKAIVTGHTKGLGAAIAAELIARGIPVLGLARSRSAGAAPGLLTEIEVDLSDSAALAAFVSGASLRDWLADAATTLLVNNAGVVAPVGPLAEQDPLARHARRDAERGRAAGAGGRRRARKPRGAAAHPARVERGGQECLSRLERLLRHQGRARPPCRSGAAGRRPVACAAPAWRRA
jgi:hypothetical protein